MKEKMYKFMYGRYGNDQLNRFLIVVSLILWIISIFTTGFLGLIAVVLIGYSYFRMFSRNIYKRADENTRYLQMTYKIKGFTGRLRRDMATRKTHHIYSCPQCRQRIRIPKGKGRIAVRCPKCSTEFIKRS